MPTTLFLLATAKLHQSIVCSCRIQFLRSLLNPLQSGFRSQDILNSYQNSLALNPLFWLLAGFLTPLSVSLSLSNIHSILKLDKFDRQHTSVITLPSSKPSLSLVWISTRTFNWSPWLPHLLSQAPNAVPL